MGHRRLCKDFGWGFAAVLFAKSSFDEYFKQKRESTANYSIVEIFFV